MTIVAHKYTPGEVSEAELEATFAAREHTVEFLLKSLRDQTNSGTLSSFVVLGPRGAGKSTVIRMVVLRIKQDVALSLAWLPVVFPEEQFEVTSLRDLLATTLRILAAQGIPESALWSEKVAAEANDEQSLQLAITALRSISRAQKKRLILFVENLNLLLEESITDQEKGTLRRLLMTDPFMLMIGSAVHVLASLINYDEAFFNYFAAVRLQRLDADGVFELLRRRAVYDGNQPFLAAFAQFRPRIRAIVQLSGGNPRLVLMLYELLSQQRVSGIVEQLRQLVDELTPLLKDEVEHLAPQQRKIIHALMEKGGTAQPADLVTLTRLPLGTVTSQLRRLKDAQFVELLGGGKGRRASYTVPDQLFKIWYEMRYLRKNRRRIEMFVEVLRAWFEAEERLAILKTVVSSCSEASPKLLRENAWSAEYFAASLSETTYGQLAREDALRQWLLSGDFNEAASVLCDLAPKSGDSGDSNPASSLLRLSRWCADQDYIPDAMRAANRAVDANRGDIGIRAEALNFRGRLRELSGDRAGAIADYTEVSELADVPAKQLAYALVERGRLRDKTSDLASAIADYTAAIETQGIDTVFRAYALLRRGLAQIRPKDWVSAITDFSEIVGMADVPSSLRIDALECRAMAWRSLSRFNDAIADYTSIMESDGASAESIANAMLERGRGWRVVGDPERALADLSAAIAHLGVAPATRARAFLERAIVRTDRGELSEAIADYSAAICAQDASLTTIATAHVQRGLALMDSNEPKRAVEDFDAAARLPGAPESQIKRALVCRRVAKLELGDVLEVTSEITAAAAKIGQHIPSEWLSVLHLPLRALFRISRGKVDDAMQDLKALVNSKDIESGAASTFVSAIIAESGKPENEALLKPALNLFHRWYETLPKIEQQGACIGLFAGLASPKTRDLWLTTWRDYRIEESFQEADALEFLPCVAAVLEGADRSILEPLPPEQRELAVTLLKRFDGESKTSRVVTS